MIEIMALAFVAGFILEFIDSYLGGGFGTVLTPLFLIAGFELPQIVPMILLSETFTGLSGGLFHHGFGNVDKKAVLLVAPFAIIGTLIALLAVVKIDKVILTVYIGLLVLTLGLFLLIKYCKNESKVHKSEKHPWRLPFIGGLIGFNKAVSGGGFGPIATAGLSWSGYNPKKSVGSTTLTEGLVCLAGFGGYWVIKGVHLNWALTIPLIIGAVLATFPAAYATHKTPSKAFGIFVAVSIILLGIGVLINLP